MKPRWYTDVPEFAPYPQVTRAREALRSGHWAGARGLLASLTDPDDLAFAVSHVQAADPDCGALLRRVVGETDDDLARLVLGTWLLHRAFTIKTSPREPVAASEWGLYRDLVMAVDSSLDPVATAGPVGAVAAGLRLEAAHGLGRGTADCWRHYEAATAEFPSFFTAQMAMLVALSPKWTEKTGEMYAFAEMCLNRAPDGTGSGALIPLALLEHRHVLRRGQQRLLQDARDRIADSARRSVLHPGYRAGYVAGRQHSAFAAAYSLAGDHQSAAPHFRALGRRPSPYPWGLERSPLHSFRKHRRLALRLP